jgi:hypothetical protein
VDCNHTPLGSGVLPMAKPIDFVNRIARANANEHRCVCYVEAVRTHLFYFASGFSIKSLTCRSLSGLLAWRNYINRMFFSSNWKLMKLAII